MSSREERRGRPVAALWPWRVAGAMVLLGSLVLAPLGAGGKGLPGGSWSNAAHMVFRRAFHTATLLRDGRVLVVSGSNFGESDTTLANAEVYNPATGTWRMTGSIHYGRDRQSATLLHSGQMLIAGGEMKNLAYGTAELYDPATGTFTFALSAMRLPRVDHTATLLQDGRVLVAGGCGGLYFACGLAWSSAELYDPATQTFTATLHPMTSGRLDATATLLTDGTVLLAGGAGCNYCAAWSSAELYDPKHDAFRLTGTLHQARAEQTATLLPDGKVLVAGGCAGTYNNDYCARASALSSAELYDSRTGTWTPTGSLHVARWGHTATLLPDGRVLVAGGVGDTCGRDYCAVLSSAELYDPKTGIWTMAPAMGKKRVWDQAVLLRDSRVLVTGGCWSQIDTGCNYPPQTAEASAELFIP